MDVQNIIVLLMVAAALAYFGILVTRKLRKFKPNAGCGSDCGCGSPDTKRS